ncbi:MAG TPA: protein tyrosine phosphatase family protein [Chthoniobacterales bacterium]|jgi:protein tyrosine phosphatase (PTP) superfamily phosphohydrolase (DUF442 family)|nr:protein tyrosine phosphatase family protein [Chthoniobacterales bacterium]
MKTIITFFALTMILPAAATAQTSAGSPASEDFSNIQNFFRVNRQFCTGGQPSMENLKKMKTEGVRSVINLRLASEYNFEEEASLAKKLDLRYFHIPVDKTDLKDEQVQKFLEVTGDPENVPMFIHCTSAGRVGTFWMIRRVLVDNWKIEDAKAEARKIGMHDEKLRDWALDYIKRHEKTDEKK